MFIHFRKSIAVIAFMSAMLLLTSLCSAAQNTEPKSDAIPDNLISFGSEREPRYAVIVEKKTQTLYLFSHDGNTTREVLRFNCSTGESSGPKTKSGDSKTPEGIYFFVKEHLKRDLSPIYGSRAYPIDYPNILDRLAGRDGNSIWLHGTNKPLKPRDSNGCIVLENSDIDALAKYITLNQTPIIIVERLSFDSEQTRTESETVVNRFIKEWTQALQNGTYHDFLSLYDPSYLPDIRWWPDWYTLRKGVDARIILVSGQVSAYRNKDLYVLLFDQSFHSTAGDAPIGKRKLFIRRSGNRFRIIGDEYLTTAVAQKPSDGESPLLAVYQTVIPKPEKESGIEDMIQGWLEAWSAKDIDSYGAYYAEHFRSQGMNRRRWIRYKDSLNKKYAYIKVSADNLVIKEGGNRSIATFLQTYRSPAYHAVGTKKLVLVRENGRWKIFREIWEKR